MGNERGSSQASQRERTQMDENIQASFCGFQVCGISRTGDINHHRVHACTSTITNCCTIIALRNVVEPNSITGMKVMFDPTLIDGPNSLDNNSASQKRVLLKSLPEDIIQRIVKLRDEGRSFRVIGAETGMAHGSCQRVYKTAMSGKPLANALAIPKRARLGSAAKPDFEKIDKAISQGSDIKSAWRAYAASTARAYSYTHFSQLYRVWLNERREGGSSQGNAVTRHSVEEFIVSKDYWRDRADPRSSILTLDRATLKVERGELVVWDGETERRFQKVVHSLKAIVFAGFAGTLSFQVIKWCELQNIALITTGWYGDFIGITGTHLTSTVDLRRAQYRANTFHVARSILEQKLLSGARIGRLSQAAHAKALARLKTARVNADLFPIEAEAALSYWDAWVFDLHFVRRNWPASWERFEHRASPISGGGRHATHPVNAILNFSYSIAAAHLTRALAAYGFDPACGFLHADAPGRMSLAYDSLELLRAAVDSAILPWVASHKWKRADFPVTPTGIVRLHSTLTAVVAQHATAAVAASEVDKVCKWLDDTVRGAAACTPIAIASACVQRG
jgi:CRISP-associated protein Cas1